MFANIYILQETECYFSFIDFNLLVFWKQANIAAVSNLQLYKLRSHLAKHSAKFLKVEVKMQFLYMLSHRIMKTIMTEEFKAVSSTLLEKLKWCM